MSDGVATGISNAEYQRAVSESIRRREKVRELSAKVADLEAKLVTVTTERDKLAADLTTLATERDGYKAKLETQPNELRAEVERLTSEVRSRDHKAKFKDLAKGKVNPEAIETAWNLMGWKSEADEVDDAKMSTAIDSLVGIHTVLKDPGETDRGDGGAVKTSQQPRAAGPGVGRGGEQQQRDPDAELAKRYPNPGRFA